MKGADQSAQKRGSSVPLFFAYAGFLMMRLNQCHCLVSFGAVLIYRKVPEFSDVRKLCCNLPEIQIKRPNHWVFCQKDATGIANSGDPDQTAPLGAV